MFKVIQRYRIVQDTHNGRFNREALSVRFILNRAAYDHNCFSINGCHGYKKRKATKFSFYFIEKLRAQKRRLFIAVAERGRPDPSQNAGLQTGVEVGRHIP